MFFARNANVSSQGKKVPDGRCEMPGEAEPIPGQTCPIETAPGELQDIEVKGTRLWHPSPEPLRFRDIVGGINRALGAGDFDGRLPRLQPGSIRWFSRAGRAVPCPVGRRT